MCGVQVGWVEGGFANMEINGGDEISAQTFFDPFFENIDRRSCNDGNRELIPVFDNPN